MKTHLKRIATSALGRAHFFPTPLTRHGEIEQLVRRLRPRRAGAELIRLGPVGDGGYLVPNDLSGIDACFSPGVNTISGFEEHCANLGMQVFMADRSVNGPAAVHERFHFIKKFVGATTSDSFMTMDDWVIASHCKASSDLLLQIDIEGYEYETFLSMSNRLLNRFRIIVAEFHGLDMLWSRPFFSLASSTFEKILQGHTCVHIHPNNCCGSLVKGGLVIPRVMEFTFLRNDRYHESSSADAFPHRLDYDNTGNPPIPLPACWIAQG